MGSRKADKSYVRRMGDKTHINALAFRHEADDVFGTLYAAVSGKFK